MIMKKLLLFLCFAQVVSAVNITPIKNGRLDTPLDANNFAITNLASGSIQETNLSASVIAQLGGSAGTNYNAAATNWIIYTASNQPAMSTGQLAQASTLATNAATTVAVAAIVSGTNTIPAGSIAFPGILERFASTNTIVILLGDSWNTPEFFTSLLGGIYYTNRVSSYTNLSANGAGIYTDGPTTNVWAQYTNYAKPIILARAAGQDVDVHIHVGLNESGSTWTDWCPKLSNFVYTVRADGGRPILYTIPALANTPDVSPGGFYDTHRFSKNQYMRQMIDANGFPMWTALIDQAAEWHDAKGDYYATDFLHLTAAGMQRRAAWANDSLMRGQTFAHEEVARNAGSLWVPMRTLAWGTNQPIGSINFVWPHGYTNTITISGTTNEPEGSMIGRQYPGSLALVTNGTAWLKVTEVPTYWDRPTNGASTGWKQILVDGAANMTTTNLYTSAIFVETNTVSAVPAANSGHFWNSNYVLYWVTPYATNLVKDGRAQE